MMKFFLFLFCLFTTQFSLGISGSIRLCIERTLNLTQSCTNPNRLYVTTLGQSSGFGSEFIAYLMNSLLTAMMQNKRMVYLVSKRSWEYDCPQHLGWACYFTFQAFGCPQNLTISTYSTMDLSNQKNVHEEIKESGSSFLEHELLYRYEPSRQDEVLQRMKLIQTLYGIDKNLIEQDCNLEISNTPGKNSNNNKILPASILAGLLATNLYKLSSAYQQSIQQYNQQRYGHLLSTPTGYFALQLRLTDKKYETPEADWQYISNMSYIARRVHSLLHESHNRVGGGNIGHSEMISKIFIGKSLNKSINK
jgi:hypothetical protein